MNHIKKSIYIISISVCTVSLLFTPAPVIAKSVLKAQIRWKKVAGAAGYLVKIKTAGDRIVLRNKTTKASLEFSLPYGSYKARIIVLNKFQKPQGWSSWFPIRIKKPIKPVVTSISESQFESKQDNTKITIKGDNFIKGCTVSLRRHDDIIKLKNVIRSSQKEVSFFLNPSETDNGEYDLIITNPGNRTTVLENKISITSSKYKLYFGISPVFNLLLPEWNSLMNNSIYGINLYAGYNLPFFKTIPVLSNIGVEAEIGFSNYSSKQNIDNVKTSLMTLLFGGGIFLSEDFSLPVDFILRGGGGFGISPLKKEYPDSEIKGTTHDPYYYFGGSIRYTFSNSSFLEAGANYQNVIYIGNQLKVIQSFLRIGLEL